MSLPNIIARQAAYLGYPPTLVPPPPTPELPAGVGPYLDHQPELKPKHTCCTHYTQCLVLERENARLRDEVQRLEAARLVGRATWETE